MTWKCSRSTTPKQLWKPTQSLETINGGDRNNNIEVSRAWNEVQTDKSDGVV
jgi:hypothetical protein